MAKSNVVGPMLIAFAIGMTAGAIIMQLNLDAICASRAKRPPIDCRCSCDGQTSILEIVGNEPTQSER